MHAPNRRAEFKSPPASRRVSQDDRRLNALAEQKKRREQRVNTARNIDLFSSLSLSGADEEDDETKDDQGIIIQEGLGAFAPLLSSQKASSSVVTSLPTRSPKSSKKKRARATPKSRAPSKYANICMYAELLELKDGDSDQWPGLDPASYTKGLNGGNTAGSLPSDLETGWVALAPIPKGKRCLTVSHQNNGNLGVVTSTHLHSRLKGTKLLKFPSPLPPDSVLDCILDVNWETTGIIHVLDILRWRGSDFLDCEAEFRFWWRDQRISEIVALSPPAAQPSSQNNSVPTAQFPYPFIFLPVPYHTPPIPLSTFLINVIPAARTIREVTVPIPTFDSKGQAGGPVSGNDAGMEVDQGQGSMDEFGRATKGEFVGGSAPSTSGPAPVVATTSARIQTDGILLYVSEASYQPGETPLSCWIPEAPLNPLDRYQPAMLDIFERIIQQRLTTDDGSVAMED